MLLNDEELYKTALNEVFPIITPEQPYKCTTHQMNMSARNKIASELRRAQNIITIWLNRDHIPNVVNFGVKGLSYDCRKSKRKGSYIDHELMSKLTKISLKSLFDLD